jgi:hypothetical protein
MKMASTKLLQSHRDFLNGLARESVKCPAEEMADKVAYAKAAPLVRKIVEAKYPPKDMKLLAKYEVAEQDHCIRLQLTSGGITQFTFRGDDAPMRPTGYDCGRHIYATGEDATSAVLTSATAEEAFKKAKATKLSDYNALIAHSTNLEQIESVWPAATALRARFNRSVPVILSDDVVARIRADVAKAA